MAKIDYSSDSCILSINGDVIGRLAKCEIERSIFDAQVYDGLRKSIDDVFLNLSVDIPNGMKLMLVQEAYEVHPMCAAMSQCDPSPLLDQLIEKLKNMNSQTVHPMCAAMTNNGGGVQRDWLKHFAEQTINQASVEGKTPTNVIADEPHEYPKYDVGGPLTDLMRINESCISIPPCQKCGCEPMMRVEERGMKNKHCWMQCTGCKNRTVVRSVEILAIRDWSQGDMWSEPPQARAGRYFPKEIADAINAGIQVNESASPAAGESAPISPEVPQAQRRSLPNAVMQTTPTNCFSACVATVLGIPITEVPIACDGAWWDWDAFQEWLAGRGLQAIEMTFENGGTLYPVRRAVRCILTGPSPRECTTGRHAIVGDYIGLDGFELLHDPHESQMWLDGEPTHAVFFVHLRSPAAAESPPISAEEAQAHGMTTPATPSAAVGADEPGAGDTEKLLPCPFCGESPDTHKWCGESLWNHESTDWHEVKCRKCDFEMQECEDIEALTARWNRRAAGDTVPRAEDRTKQQGLQIAELIDQLDVKDDTISKLSAENYRLTKLNHHLREAAVMAIVERVPSDSKPTNVHNPESEGTPPHNQVMGPVVGTAKVTFHDQSKTVPPEAGKRYMCRNGEVTKPMRGKGSTCYPYTTEVGPKDVLRTWTETGKHDLYRDGPLPYDLIAEYHDPESSTPAESDVDRLQRELDAAVEYHDNYTSKIDKALGQPRHGGDLLTGHLKEIERLKALSATTSPPAESPVPDKHRYAIGDTVRGSVLWGDGSIMDCKIVNLDAGISREAFIVDMPDGRAAIMLLQSILDPLQKEPAESPDDWVMITDPEHVIRRRQDECRLRAPAAEWGAVSYLTGDKIGIWPDFDFRCRRKDLPPVLVEKVADDVLELTDLPASVKTALNEVIKRKLLESAAPSDKPRMRQVTLREYRHTDESTAWSSSGWLVESRLTGRTCVTEVPE